MIHYKNVSHEELGLHLFRSRIDAAQFSIVGSEKFRHLGLDFEVHIIGASHLVQCDRWAELFSCIDEVEGAAFSFPPDLIDAPLTIAAKDLGYIYNFELKRAVGAFGVQDVRWDPQDCQFAIKEVFPTKDPDNVPTTSVGVNLLENGWEVRSLHYYAHESIGVYSRSKTILL